MEAEPDSAYRRMKNWPSDLEECEHLESYEQGGFHPVHLGDVYDGRY